jgi:hypothetical protein
MSSQSMSHKTRGGVALSMERFREHEGARHIVLFLYNKAGSPSQRRQVRGKTEGHLATPLMTKTPKRSSDLATVKRAKVNALHRRREKAWRTLSTIGTRKAGRPPYRGPSRMKPATCWTLSVVSWNASAPP